MFIGNNAIYLSYIPLPTYTTYIKFNFAEKMKCKQMIEKGEKKNFIEFW